MTPTTQPKLTDEQVLEVIDSCVSACEEYVRFGEDNPRLNNLRAARTAVAGIIAERDSLAEQLDYAGRLLDTALENYANTEKELKLAEAARDASQAALERIAAYNDTAAWKQQRQHNSYSHFDEPHSVEIAHTALKAQPSLWKSGDGVEQPTQPDVVAGWKLVPIEPTPEMLSDAGVVENYDVDAGGKSDADHIAWWKAMVAASPSTADVAGWMPIETAPKDGTPVLLLIAETDDSNFMEDALLGRTIGMYGVNGGPEVDPTWSFPGWNWCGDEFENGRGTPIKWQPLPAAPDAVSHTTGQEKGNG